MYCKECNFIMKGIETKCPYCGTPFEKELFLDKKINLFKNLTLTIKQLIELISFNIVALVIIVDIIYSSTMNIELHLTPWVFTGVYGLVFILVNFLLKSVNSNKMLFFKFVSFIVIFSVMILISYRHEPLLSNGIKNYQLIIGYLYPFSLIIMSIVGTIKIFVKKYYNIFSNIVYVILEFFFAGILFILRYIKPIGLCDYRSMKLLITIAFILSCVILFNTIILVTLTLKTKVTSED